MLFYILIWPVSKHIQYQILGKTLALHLWPWHSPGGRQRLQRPLPQRVGFVLATPRPLVSSLYRKYVMHPAAVAKGVHKSQHNSCQHPLAISTLWVLVQVSYNLSVEAAYKPKKKKKKKCYGKSQNYIKKRGRMMVPLTINSVYHAYRNFQSWTATYHTTTHNMGKPF